MPNSHLSLVSRIENKAFQINYSQQLSEYETKVLAVREAVLYAAFLVDSFLIYKQFTTWWLCPNVSGRGLDLGTDYWKL